MTTHWQTVAILVAVTIGLIGWDVYAYYQQDRGAKLATISETVLAAARKWTVIPFLLGVLMGHLLWPQ